MSTAMPSTQTLTTHEHTEGELVAERVTQRLIEVYQAVVVERMTPAEAADRFGFASRQLFHNYVRKLVEMGYIRRRADLPEKARWEDVYPYEPTGKPMEYSPPPPDARLRLTWPVESQGDLTVPTVRVVRWKDWLVQGVPILRLDGSSGRAGRPPDDKVPNLRVVVISDVTAVSDPPEPEEGVCFLASVRERWHESDTALELAGQEEDTAGMTQAIACALGVEAVLDVSMGPPQLDEGTAP